MTTGYPISFAADIASSVVNIEWPGGLGIFVVFKNFSNNYMTKIFIKQDFNYSSCMYKI